MAIVMGSADDHTTLDRACDLGIAFQLNNIARDVMPDAANDAATSRRLACVGRVKRRTAA
jgi:hypothetical protein